MSLSGPSMYYKDGNYCLLGADKVLSEVLSELLQKIYRLTGENPDDSNK